jgi:hypothetical protein
MDIKLVIPLHIQQKHLQLQLDYHGISPGNMTTIDGVEDGKWDLMVTGMFYQEQFLNGIQWGYHQQTIAI